MAQAAAKKPGQDAYTWEGVDKQGKKVKGEMQGASVAIVNATLRRQGINPLKVQKTRKPFFNMKKKITAKDVAVFTRLLSTMLLAGIPVVQALDIVGKGHENPSMQELLLTIKQDIESGTNLTQALSKYPLYFDSLYCNLVQAGEQAGILDNILDKIAIYKEKTEGIKGKIKAALFYPAAVVVVAFIVTAVLLYFVIPQFESMFKSFGGELPALTQMVINMSKTFQQWWWAIIGGIVGTVVGIGHAYKRSPKMQHGLDRALLKAPIFGVLVKKATIARFARTLSTMFAAGVPLVEALDSVAGASGNRVYYEGVMEVKNDVSTGTQLQTAMNSTGLFPNMVIQMVAIGEESGELDKMLSKAADFYEQEVDDAVAGLSSLMEPIIMAFLGVIVGGLVIAMYLPVFKMGGVV
ncbi:MAG: type II secretion system protein F [Candidatus Muproteobacteria bacterium RBG_16_65_34]|uniref:Type II secretion system protein F n=1 Tax=Candidatus Muproteobacteria bacterium RBG_16_65_34 TaxID=1817760 RepID=A0A1F6TUN6_9PROT|nr:MAG: type II secretion system protein F [Candidatus Muproteobacteria bacterium RBG_16_65_34]